MITCHITTDPIDDRPIPGESFHTICGVTVSTDVATVERYLGDPLPHAGTYCAKCEAHEDLPLLVLGETDL